jgi:ATP-dependent DNA helicase RecG
VNIRHERLASYEQLILEYLEEHETIRNKQARDICFVDGDYRMRRVLARLEDRELIERVPGTSYGWTAYRRGPKFAEWRKKLSDPSKSDERV